MDKGFKVTVIYMLCHLINCIQCLKIEKSWIIQNYDLVTVTAEFISLKFGVTAKLQTYEAVGFLL